MKITHEISPLGLEWELSLYCRGGARGGREDCTPLAEMDRGQLFFYGIFIFFPFLHLHLQCYHDTPSV